MNETIKVESIIVGDRLRKDLGDLGDLDTISTVGLIQPIVLDRTSEGTHRLVAGGRRLAKLKELGIETVEHGITSVAGKAGFVYANELPEDVARECELYENIGRKQMSWQERVLAIAEIHVLKKNRAALDGESWGQAETGAEIGQHYSYVSYALVVAAHLRNPESPVWEMGGLTEALRWLTEQRENLAKQQLAELTVKTIPAGVDLNNSNAQVQAGTVAPTQGSPLVVPLSQMLLFGKMEGLGKPDSCDHIITDWPYGIDLGNLDQGVGMNVSRVEAEHGEQENIADFAIWLDVMYHMLRDRGYCVVWYDNVHWNLMRHLAEKVGFRVQRWPLVWVKTSPCLNQMASKNWTKATEFAMVLAKGNATLHTPQPVNYWSGPRAETTSNPFAKPRKLWKWILDAFALKGQTIGDPFAGEGSSTVATIDFGCQPLAIETNENHFNQLNINVQEMYRILTGGNVTFV